MAEMSEANGSPQRINQALVTGGAQPKKINDTTSSETCSIFVFSLVFSIIFGLYTTQPDRYGGPTSALCERTSFINWSYASFIYHCVALFFSIFVLPIISFRIKSSIENRSGNLKQLAGFYQCLRVLLAIPSFTIFVGICATYGDADVCGDLKQVALAYIIISSIGMCVAVLVMCCACCTLCLAGGVLAMAARADHNHENQTNSNPT